MYLQRLRQDRQQHEEVQQLPGGGLLQPCLPGAALEAGRAQAGVFADGGWGERQRWRWWQQQELNDTIPTEL